MNITVNGQQIDFAEGETVLAIAKRSGIRIPNLCHQPWSPHPAASCRVCLVEVEGWPRLVPSCTLAAQDGMVVRTHSPRVQRMRRNIVELLLAGHPEDCLYCSRVETCELSALARELGVKRRYPSGVRRRHAYDVSSPAILRDPNKCILCGRCVAACHFQQKVGAIDFAGRGFETRVAPAFHEGLNVSECVYCGQCVKACPTGALTERSHVEQVVQALADPDVAVVAQVAPAVPATLMEEGVARNVVDALELLSGALKAIGVEAVFDTCFAADLTIMEEASELVHRVTTGGALPMFTSCSPAWIRYVEAHRPELLPHLSSCKSPQQMAAALIRDRPPECLDLGDRRLFSVSVMPCTAKKMEADEQGCDPNAVLTTRECHELLERFGLQLDPSRRASLDSPFGEATGAGRIFAGSGGVMEAALRTAHRLITGEELPKGPKVEQPRGLGGLKVFTLPVGDQTLRFAVVNGLGEVDPVIDDVLAGRSDLHFIEVMSCPGGCVGGGGQPHGQTTDDLRRRLNRLYDADRRAPKRSSHDNEQVRQLYATWLGSPLGPESHRLLHREYTDRSSGCSGCGGGCGH